MQPLQKTIQKQEYKLLEIECYGWKQQVKKIFGFPQNLISRSYS